MRQEIFCVIVHVWPKSDAGLNGFGQKGACLEAEQA